MIRAAQSVRLTLRTGASPACSSSSLFLGARHQSRNFSVSLSSASVTSALKNAQNFAPLSAARATSFRFRRGFTSDAGATTATSSTSDGIGRYSAIAALAAFGAVTAGAQASNSNGGGVLRAGEKVPDFDMEKPRYDLNDYWGRVKQMQDNCDMFTLMTTDDELKAARDLIQEFKDGKFDKTLKPVKSSGWGTSSKSAEPAYNSTQQERDEMNLKLWDARKLVDCIIHPVTGEEMYWAGRMSAFVPVNFPVLCGMLIHGPTSKMAAAFWQWINQSVNVFCNYVNRSGAEVDWALTIKCYFAACGTSVVMAMTGMTLLETYPVLQTVGPLVPYLSVIAASTANLTISRIKEISYGIPIYDADGNRLGDSGKAGIQGVWKTLWTRSWALPIPLLIFPPVVTKIVKAAVTKNPAALMIVEGGMVVSMLYFMLPLAIAILPPTMELKATDLEEEFHNLKDKNGNKIEIIYANKGL